jgi:uncharacterized protein (DUF305 family)
MKRMTIGGAAALVALAAAGAALAVGGQPGPPAGRGMGMGAGMGPGAGMMTGAVADANAHFIQMMVPHHEQAIAMAKLAQQKGDHADVKALAADVVKTQTAEIAQMKAWYRAWYGSDLPAVARRANALAGLQAAAPFDKAFLAQMYRHHAMGVRMIDMLLPSVDKAELATLMKEMRATQSAEMTKMAAWYRSWYGADIAAAAPGTRGGMGAGFGGGHCMGNR